MFDVNEYFGGNVMSIGGFKAEGLKSTVGVMAPGDYEFSTGSKEYMTVISGKLTIQLANEDEWTTYSAGETFEVEADSKFHVRVKSASSYLCRYE